MKRRGLLAFVALSGLGGLGVTGAVVTSATAHAGESALAPPRVPPSGVGLFVALGDAGVAIVPVSGAGIFDVDPDQSAVSQDPDVVVSGDTDALSEDSEL